MFDNQRSDASVDPRNAGCVGGLDGNVDTGRRTVGLRARVLAGLTVGCMVAGSGYATIQTHLTISPSPGAS